MAWLAWRSPFVEKSGLIVKGKVGGWHLQVQEVLPPGQVECPALRQGTGALFENVGDIFCAERLKLEGIRHGLTHLLCTVAFRQGHDACHMLLRVESSFGQLLVIFLRPGGKAQETQEHSLLTRVFALLQEFPGVIWILDILVTIKAADMPCDQPVLVKNTDAIGVVLLCYINIQCNRLEYMV